ncbi:MAG TPA: TIGR03767 family metallophosphoesterase [Marmoricola sp.]|jgi:metallophosphoesterase (TIGR03767 family)|nr:TIGR03767 family metallophosphoesterase [Marmoricola sp.]
MMQVGVTSVGALWLGAPSLRPVLATSPRGSTAGTTLQAALRKAHGHGYHRLRVGPADPVIVRSELAAGRSGREDRRTGAGTLVQVSDLHIADAQHPMRFEYLDRINGVGHRAHEMLGTQGTTALVGAINALKVGPWSGRPIDAVMSTGDNTDNQSQVELEWLLGILAGGTVHPDSGTMDGYEGVANSGLKQYWQPGSHHSDAYKHHGFPHIPGLLEAATRPFVAPGLDFPWVLTMGNHDDVVGGMLGNRGYTDEWAVGGRKIFTAHDDAAYHLATMLKGVKAGDNANGLLHHLARSGHTRHVHADPRRRRFTGTEFVDMLHQPQYAGAGPVGHGFTAGADEQNLYFSYQASSKVRVISLDTTNQAGGALGSIGTAQLSWLRAELRAATDSYVLVLSHHPSTTMTNLARDPRAPHERRHNGAAVLEVLHQFPNVVAWVNGHTHHNKITPHQHHDARRSFWEINSASHTDAPQQARVIEVVENADGTISLFTTMLDAASPAAVSHDDLSTTGLASLYRELAYNDPQFKDRSGHTHDRNTELLLADPLGA